MGVCGFWLVSIPGEKSQHVGLLLVGGSPFVAALFNHFAYRYCTNRNPAANEKLIVGAGYGAGLLTTLWSWSAGVGKPMVLAGLPGGVELSSSGWFMVAVTIGLTALGQGRLFRVWYHATPGQRRQIQTVIMASLWGFFAISGLLFTSVGWNLFPYPVLLLPGYPILLAFGLLRYQVMEVNIWARRAVAWLLLSVPLTVATMALLAIFAASDNGAGTNDLLPRAWIFQFLSLTAAFFLIDAIRRLANRIIYPGGQLDDWQVQRWTTELSECTDCPSLEATAQRILSNHLRMPVMVAVSPSPTSEDASLPTTPAIVCHPEGQSWRSTLSGWQEAPPGPRMAAELFGRIVSESVGHMERTRQAAEEARLREREAHLTELGLLAATVAHELRNPLNVVAMAAAQAPESTKGEIQRQLGRMDILIGDLLDYSKSWQVSPRLIQLNPALDNALSAFPGLMVERAIPPEMTLNADPRRFGQIMINLLTNATAALKAQPGHEPGIRLEAQERAGERLLFLCNQGAPIPDNIRERIFSPFVSRFEGGTGLGLAIVARIMEAHGGRIQLTERAGWNTCFKLSFPEA
ncbi:MAG: HAMP domain-containing histidine kinase [Magnetococcales bacterium]|nr:HAMP domain-containing histidine kinase [Magnetococcales bacterium]